MEASTHEKATGVNGTPRAIVARDTNAVMVRPTVLGASAQRIPIGGTIRAGIKVLTRKAAEDPNAQRIYDQGVAAGKGFERIEQEIQTAVPALTNPLVPKNVPYFTVRGGDFPNPEIAALIMRKYGEDRGEGLQLYRFPVVFPADAWQSVMPHELVAWGSSGRRFWSEYSDDGARHCMHFAPVPVDGNGRRALRLFGGRKTIRREENGGVCDPEQCPQYQKKECNLSGRFIFYIPGVPSLAAFQLGTNSFYAMQAAIERFQAIGFMRGGRISGFLDGNRTPFYITKRLVEVRRIGEQGEVTKARQWLIELEAPVDVTALLSREDGLEAIEHRAADAADVLEGEHGQHGATVVATHGRGVVDVVDAEPLPANSGQRQGVATATGDRAGSGVEGPGSDRRAQAAAIDPQKPSAEGARAAAVKSAAGDDDAEKAVKWILDSAAAQGVPADRYEAYAGKVMGKGWKLAAGGRKRALEEIQRLQDEPGALKKKVDAELDVFS